jgi:hypothetical protein
MASEFVEKLPSLTLGEAVRFLNIKRSEPVGIGLIRSRLDNVGPEAVVAGIRKCITEGWENLDSGIRWSSMDFDRQDGTPIPDGPEPDRRAARSGTVVDERWNDFTRFRDDVPTPSDSAQVLTRINRSVGWERGTFQLSNTSLPRNLRSFRNSLD